MAGIVRSVPHDAKRLKTVTDRGHRPCHDELTLDGVVGRQSSVVGCARGCAGTLAVERTDDRGPKTDDAEAMFASIGTR